MTGWQNKHDKKKLETADIWFNKKHHQPGKKKVLGKTYKSGKKGLAAVIKDLVNHPSCREFVANRLCTHFITDEPTKEMKAPIIKAFKDSDGSLPEIHKATIKVIFEHNKKYKKFQNPENWFIQLAKISDIQWPPSTKLMDLYELGNKPTRSQKQPTNLLRKIGYNPYRAKQPNGWSDISTDWLSPELLIRRLIYAKESYLLSKPENNNNEFYDKIVQKNFDNSDKILEYINKKDKPSDKQTLLFNHPEFLKA